MFVRITKQLSKMKSDIENLQLKKSVKVVTMSLEGGQWVPPVTSF